MGEGGGASGIAPSPSSWDIVPTQTDTPRAICKGESAGAFAAEIEISQFQKRMRVGKEVEVECRHRTGAVVLDGARDVLGCL